MIIKMTTGIMMCDGHLKMCVTEFFYVKESVVRTFVSRAV